MLFQNITGKKETKGFNEALIIACPTPGEFRITPMAADILNLADGDSGIVVIDPENKSQVYIAKGLTGVPVRDENGVIQKDDRGRVIYEEDSQFGAVIRTASEGSVLLKLTAAAAWNAVGGDKDFNKEFTLGEPIQGEVPMDGRKDEKGDPLLHSALFYPLEFKEARKKMNKKAKGEAGEGVETEINDTYEDPSFQEQEV